MMTEPGESLSVGIAGAGAIAFGAAAFLEDAGHRASLWSRSDARLGKLAAGEPLVASGAVEGRFHPRVAASAADLVDGAEVILVAVPAYGHKAIFDALAPHLRAGQRVLISSHASLGALYLSRLLADRGLVLPIVAWGTTVTSGRQPSPVEAQVNTIRGKVDICTLPQTRSAEGLACVILMLVPPCYRFFDHSFNYLVIEGRFLPSSGAVRRIDRDRPRSKQRQQ